MASPDQDRASPYHDTPCPGQGAGPRTGTTGGVSRAGRAVLDRSMALVVALAVVGLLASARPVLAQGSATGGVVVQVPVVSELDVARAAASGVEGASMFRLQVRANHPWQVRVSAPGAERTVWVRTTVGGDGESRRLEPGGTVAVAAGGRGVAMIEVECRWEPATGEPEPTLLYTVGEKPAF